MRPLLRNFKSSESNSESSRSTISKKKSSEAKTSVDVSFQKRLPTPISNALGRLKPYGTKRDSRPNYLPPSSPSSITKLEETTSASDDQNDVPFVEQPILNSKNLDTLSLNEVSSHVSVHSSVAGEINFISETNVTNVESIQDSQPEVISLARRIQFLITSSMPRIYSNTDNTSANTSSIEPGLISILSSIPIMNGSLPQGRESVWSILDRLRFSPSNSVSVLSGGSSGIVSDGSARDVLDTVEDDRSFEDTSSVMLYSPLIPDNESEVEVARSEIISLNDGVTITTQATIGDDDIGSMIDGDRFYYDADGRGKLSTPSNSKKGKEKLVWVPSTTKISLQATWWGYRIYLPPPVIAVLNNQSVEAANRAMIITTALKWLLDHVPSTAVPPQFRIALVTLRQLVPIIGYLGTFIGWSWKAVKGFDKGYGVVLSATWLLPIAPIPGTWEEADFPKTPE